LAKGRRSFEVAGTITEIFMRWNFAVAAMLLLSLTPVPAQTQVPLDKQQQQQPRAGTAGAFGPATASPEIKQARRAMRQACIEDIRALCAGSEPGGAKIMMCLRSHREQVSDGCKAATQHLRDLRRRA
jgi:Cysteine rich repeat